MAASTERSQPFVSKLSSTFSMFSWPTLSPFSPVARPGTAASQRQCETAGINAQGEDIPNFPSGRAFVRKSDTPRPSPRLHRRKGPPAGSVVPFINMGTFAARSFPQASAPQALRKTVGWQGGGMMLIALPIDWRRAKEVHLDSGLTCSSPCEKPQPKAGAGQVPAFLIWRSTSCSGHFD